MTSIRYFTSGINNKYDRIFYFISVGQPAGRQGAAAAGYEYHVVNGNINTGNIVIDTVRRMILYLLPAGIQLRVDN